MDVEIRGMAISSIRLGRATLRLPLQGQTVMQQTNAHAGSPDKPGMQAKIEMAHRRRVRRYRRARWLEASRWTRPRTRMKVLAKALAMGICSKR
jgi:hypothetical protein